MRRRNAPVLLAHQIRLQNQIRIQTPLQRKRKRRGSGVNVESDDSSSSSSEDGPIRKKKKEQCHKKGQSTHKDSIKESIEPIKGSMGKLGKSVDLL